VTDWEFSSATNSSKSANDILKSTKAHI